MTSNSQDVLPTDDPVMASDIARLVVNATGDLIDQFGREAADRCERAPRSADHLGDLTNQIAGLVLDWITRWPT